MNWKREQLRKSRVYAIINMGDTHKGSISNLLYEVLQGGADIIQLRGKTSSKEEIIEAGKMFRKLISHHNKLFIVNDYVDIAKIVNADGVHLGQDDLGIEEARVVLQDEYLIGKSTHSLSQAMEAEANEADYIGIGPVFSTPTKPTYRSIGLQVLSSVVSTIQIPTFAIGGINFSNIDEVISQGAQRIAIVRAVTESRAPRKATLDLIEAIRHSQQNSTNTKDNKYEISK